MECAQASLFFYSRKFMNKLSYWVTLVPHPLTKHPLTKHIELTQVLLSTFYNYYSEHLNSIQICWHSNLNSNADLLSWQQYVFVGGKCIQKFFCFFVFHFSECANFCQYFLLRQNCTRLQISKLSFSS